MAFALGAEVIRQRHTAYFLGPGNYVSPNGTLTTMTLGGNRPDLLPRSLQGLIAAAAVASVVVFAVALVPPVMNGIGRIRQHEIGRTTSPTVLIVALVALAALGYWSTCVGLYPFEFQPVDRYLFPLVPLVGILVLHFGGPQSANAWRTRVASCTALVVLGVLGFVFAANSASFDGTSWRLERTALSIAKVPQKMDVSGAWRYFAGTETDKSYARGACMRVHMEPRPKAGEEAVKASSVSGPFGAQVWVVARRVRPC